MADGWPAHGHGLGLGRWWPLAADLPRLAVLKDPLIYLANLRIGFNKSRTIILYNFELKIDKAELVCEGGMRAIIRYHPYPRRQAEHEVSGRSHSSGAERHAAGSVGREGVVSGSVEEGAATSSVEGKARVLWTGRGGMAEGQQHGVRTRGGRIRPPGTIASWRSCGWRERGGKRRDLSL